MVMIAERWDNTKIDQFIRNQCNNKYIRIDDYQNAKLPIKLHCKHCDNNFTQRIDHLIDNKLVEKCPICRRNSSNYTTQNFSRLIEEKYHGQYTLVGECINSRIPVTVKCKCGNVITTLPAEFLRDRNQCRNCAPSKLLTHEQFCERVKAIHGDAFEILGKYEGSTRRIKVKCKKCGHIYTPIAASLMDKRKRGCLQCSLKMQKEKYTLSNEQFLERLKNVHGDLYKPLEVYKDSRTKIKFHCNNCGQEFMTTPHSILSGSHCPCNRLNTMKKFTVSNEEFQKRLKEKFNGEIITEDKYINSSTLMTFKCTLCGKTWKSIPNGCLRRKGCSCKYEKVKREKINIYDAEHVKDIED